MQSQKIKQAIHKIKSDEIKHVAIVMHNKPDGDCIGSAVALEEMLIAIGKKVDLIIHNKISRNYAPILGRNRVEKKIMPPNGRYYDLLIMVDFSDPSRTIEGVEYMAEFIIVLDHHMQNKPFGDLHVCEDVSSTGIIVLSIIESMMTVTKSIANAVYMTLVADTNGFKNNNTNEHTFEIASKLMNHEVDINVINQIFEDKSLEYINLMGSTLSKLKFDAHYKIAYLIVTREDIVSSKVKGEDVVRLIDEIRWLKDSDISILFIEGIENVRISMRSKKTPINKVLEKFGGGGHPKAAGCAINDADIDFVVNDVLTYLKKVIDKNSRK